MTDTQHGSQSDDKRSISFDDKRSISFDDKRSVSEVLLETLTQGGLRPALAASSTGRLARFRRIAGRLALVLGLVAVGVFVVSRLSGPPPAVHEPVAVLEIARGPIGVFPANADPSSGIALSPGQPIQAGTVIDTRTVLGQAAGQGAPVRAALRLANGHSVRLDDDTRVEVASRSSLRLDRGAVYVDSASSGSAVEVRTTLGVVRDIGTQFEVRILEPAAGESVLRIRIREGLIALQRDADTHEAGVGEELVMLRDGTVTRDTIPIYGPHWDWVLEAAPIPDLEGRPLSAFLDWVTREGGWTVHFDDEVTARLASTIIMHGDAENLTLAEAASMVLESSGLRYRVEEGTFFVEPMAKEASLR